MKFGTFWAGSQLPAVEFCCLQSFARHNHDVTLFSFDKIEPLPEGVRLRDAGEIVKKETLDRFLIRGKPSITPFSNYFRYKMCLMTDLTWIDTDIFMLKSFEIPDGENLFARESEKSVNGAILRIIRSEPILPELIRRTELSMDKNLRWGKTGPRLLTEILMEKAFHAMTHPPEEFYPIHFHDFWKVFLPEYYDECVELCRNAKTIHLWNNIIDRLGFWKDMLPPKKSFLHHLLTQGEMQSHFIATYPDYILRRMVENWHMRQNGKDLGIISVAKQIIPGIRRTIRHHVG
jgi:hypothetical protein